ncbi:MAG: hypothetical protein KDA57_03975 [Planctomycetales bacterium]|nr:hypothetical protein [Planctomycetales bacterium]
MTLTPCCFTRVSFAVVCIGLLGTVPVLAQEAEETQPAEEMGLEQLAWMVGEWGEADSEQGISAVCHWTRNRSFLNRSFAVTADNQVVLEGTQVIGWNAATQQIQSWTFDSEGGFGEGLWTRDGNRWMVKTQFVLSTGELASSLNVYTVVDENTIRWQSVNRELDGELLPNVEEVTITRRESDGPPEEKTSPTAEATPEEK